MSQDLGLTRGEDLLSRHGETHERLCQHVGTQEQEVRTPLELDGDLDIAELGLLLERGGILVALPVVSLDVVDQLGLQAEADPERDVISESGVDARAGLESHLLHLHAGRGVTSDDAETLGESGGANEERGRKNNQFLHFKR